VSFGQSLFLQAFAFPSSSLWWLPPLSFSGSLLCLRWLHIGYRYKYPLCWLMARDSRSWKMRTRRLNLVGVDGRRRQTLADDGGSRWKVEAERKDQWNRPMEDMSSLKDVGRKYGEQLQTYSGHQNLWTVAEADRRWWCLDSCRRYSLMMDGSRRDTTDSGWCW
jgi:hypothetical protein